MKLSRYLGVSTFQKKASSWPDRAVPVSLTIQHTTYFFAFQKIKIPAESSNQVLGFTDFQLFQERTINEKSSNQSQHITLVCFCSAVVSYS